MKYAVALLAVIALLLGYQFVYKDYAFRQTALQQKQQLMTDAVLGKPRALEDLNVLDREVIRRNGGAIPEWWR